MRRASLQALGVLMFTDGPVKLPEIKFGKYTSIILGVIAIIFLPILLLSLGGFGLYNLYEIFSVRFVEAHSLLTNTVIFGGFSLITMFYRKMYRNELFDDKIASEVISSRNSMCFILVEFIFFSFFCWQLTLAVIATNWVATMITVMGLCTTGYGILIDSKKTFIATKQKCVKSILFDLLSSVLWAVFIVLLASWFLFGFIGFFSMLIGSDVLHP